MLLWLGLRQEDTREPSRTDSSDKDVQLGWNADHPIESVSVPFECDACNGVVAIGRCKGNSATAYTIWHRL